MTRGPLNGGMADFAYDCRNRLVKVTEADGTVTLYEYDAENVRTAVISKGVRTEYTTDRESVYSQTLVKTEYEKNPLGSYTKQTSRTVYTYGQGLVGEIQDDGKELYYHYNHLGSTMAVTDGQGTILYRFVYDTYGELSDIRNGSGASLKTSEEIEELTAGYTLSDLASAAGIEYLYNGQYGVSTDQNGLYYMRARYYNQDIKRFINRDVVSGEITNSGSLNRYCYVQGNPVSLTDPFGLCPDSNSAFKNFCIGISHLDWNAIGHAALDTAGIFFEAADVINAIWYACEKNTEMAIACAISALPGVGLAAGNLLMKGDKFAAAGKVVKAIAKLTQGTMGLCSGIQMAKIGFTNFLNGLEAGTFDAKSFFQTLGGIGIALLSGKNMVSSGGELLACTGNSGKTMKGTLLDADISGAPIESGGTYANGNSSTGLFLPDTYYQKMDDNIARAIAARDAEVARIQSLSISQQRKVATVVGGVDIRTGEVFVGVKESPKYGRLAVCAEDIVFRGLGGNTNANIIMTPAIRPRTAEEISVCSRCQTKYPVNQFVKGTKFQ